jgi:hypothetical protein
MKLQQFIEKHSLSPMQFSSDWTPAMFLMDDEESRRSFSDQYEIYANAEKTIWVSVNRSRGRFRICFCDMVNICSDWLNAEIPHDLEPIQAEPRRDV